MRCGGLIEMDDREKTIEELKGLFDSVHVGMGLIDREFRFIRVNRQLAEINGLPAAEHVGRTVGEVLPGLRNDIEPFVEAAFAGAPTLGREVIKEAPGDPDTLRSWTVSYLPVKDSDGVVFAVGTLLIETTENLRLREAALAAIGRERDQIGREIHASISQEIGGIGLLAQSLLEKLNAEDHPCAEAASAIVDHLELVGRRARNVAHSLSPIALEKSRLSRALDKLAETISILHVGVDCQAMTCIFADSLPVSVASEIYFVASEAAFNAARHGSPENISITVAEGEKDLRISIEDDGGGTVATVQEGFGIGLHSIKARAWNLGGHMDIASNERGDGIVICLVIPKPENRDNLLNNQDPID